MDRRKFIQKSIAASILLAHSSIAGCAQSFSIPDAPRIRFLELKTGHKLASLLNFYQKVMELPCELKEGTLKIWAGDSVILFTQAEDGTIPFYHFAFNIPENKIEEATEWQLQRTPLLPTPSRMLDPEYRKEVRHFRNWNAHSIFFWDSAGNLLEFIARHTMDNARNGHFSSDDILCVSEIAFIVNDVNRESSLFKSMTELQQYKGGNDNFRAIGDENGLLLVMKDGRIWMPESNTPKKPGVFETIVSLNQAPKASEIKNYPYKILGPQ